MDEAGRGPLAGDVYAAAVILPADCCIEGLNDSKKLTEKKRTALYDEIRQKAVSYCVATASVEEIETYNILQATFLAMKRAVAGLTLLPSLILIDGNHNPPLPVHSRCVVKGDGLSACIAAASVLAKVERDRYMEELAAAYPQYRFEQHKGYGTKLHYEMLDQFGISPLHRHSFLKKYLAQRSHPKENRGREGEDAACDFLVGKGYRILARNYHCLYGELDIVALQGEILAFVEVKTRAAEAIASGREAVDAAKQEKLIKAAAVYLGEQENSYRARFDVMEVTIKESENQKECTMVHYENAFDGGDSVVFI